jgi:hypothetical protein
MARYSTTALSLAARKVEMKYKVNDYLASDHTVLMKIIVAMDSEGLEIYALCGINDPVQLKWMSLPEIEHEELYFTQPDLHEFYSAKVGDLVRLQKNVMCKILAAAGNAYLLSKVIGEKHFAGPPPELLDAIQQMTPGAIVTVDAIDPAKKQHLKVHDSMRYQQTAADMWVDRDIMALMNWKLVKE